jgi:hypothetical protein
LINNLRIVFNAKYFIDRPLINNLRIVFNAKYFFDRLLINNLRIVFNENIRDIFFNINIPSINNL